MRTVKPKALKHGDVIGICAPASPPVSSESLDAGIRYLERLGYRVELGKNLYRRRGYLAGSDAQRVADLHQLFSDKSVNAIFAARGGYGAHRILSSVDFPLIRKNPKILVGYSDITALQMALLTKTGLISFSGAMVADIPATFRPRSEEHFWECLTSNMPPPPLRGNGNMTIDRPSKRFADGRIVGGNLSLLAGLMGTGFFPAVRDPILLFEEIDERPYRIDRTLHQMKLTGAFDDARGVILGAFIDCAPTPGKSSLPLVDVFRDSFNDIAGPVISGIRYGHLKDSWTIPLGVRARLDGKRNLVWFLESGVR